MYCDSGNMIDFQLSQGKFSHLVKKSQFQSIMQFLISRQTNFFSSAVRNNFSMPGADKLRVGA